MRTQWFRTGALWIGAAALALATVTAAHAQEKNRAKEDPGAWIIGVACHPADTTLRVQLGLGDAPALVVDGVAAASPSGNAGIKQHDLIVEAGGKKVGQLADLSAAVQNAKGGKLTLELIRGGKKQTVEVTPVKRKSVAWHKVEAAPNGKDLDFWLNRHGTEIFRVPKGQFQFRAVHPFGVIDVHKMPPFPKNLQVRIEKNGDAPAKIVVKRDGVQWETTEDKLDKLPEDVRKYVKLMLGKTDFSEPGIMKAFNALPFGQEIAPPVPPIAPQPNVRIAPIGLPRAIEGTAVGKRLEKQLEAMNQRLDQLHKAIERLQQPKDDGKPKAE